MAPTFTANLRPSVIPGNYEEIKLSGKNVDESIVKLAKSDSKIVVATLDREIKSRIKNSKLVIRQKKRIEVI